MKSELIARRIHIQGIVQGVGFRPFVYEYAILNNLVGWVRNSSAGVEIEVVGDSESINSLLFALKNNLPPLARIDRLQISEVDRQEYADFLIHSSQSIPGNFIPISPDIGICADCQRELFDTSDRRYRYPFINCTNCGPRFTIIEDIPYDRPLTTMKSFPMCPDCKQEYANPRDRRFHAQPIACPTCGPQLTFLVDGNVVSQNENALQQARKWIKEGKIIAVKGLGGYHLACDGSNDAAVETLRNRKKRSDKPFALMAFSLDAIHRVCQVTEVEKTLLVSRQKPVVLLQAKMNAPVSKQVAPGLETLGIMLPYTPLHLLLLEPEPDYPELLVMTSGNLSEEPISYQDGEGINRLRAIADAFLIHNRDIHMRVDDSVVREERQDIYPVRRARGYAPDAVTLSKPVPQVLAAGALLKNTFCLTNQQYAFISHHIGDLENYETFRSFREGIIHYQNLFRVQPEIVTCDLHPDYLSTRHARAFADEHNLPVIEVQHHHAHLASVLAENHVDVAEPVIGLCFDGTGLGTDGAIWGGEALVGNSYGYDRAAHLAYSPLPGGDSGIRHPSRIALAYLWDAGIEWEDNLPPVKNICSGDQTTLLAQLQHKLNVPLTSSMGRLFDAVSALLGVNSEANYEGQAAILLEAIADSNETGYYEMPISNGIWETKPLLKSVLNDFQANIHQSIISARFHNSIVKAVRMLCSTIRASQAINQVALSGGVWQNRFLFRKTVTALETDNFIVYTHHQVPTNDGGISLGQAWIAANNPQHFTV